MSLDLLPSEVHDYLTSAMQTLGMSEDHIDFWEVSDYGIFVLLTERFYKTLNYRSADPVDFMNRQLTQDLPNKNSYADSRTYTALIIDHFVKHGLKPQILDIGGYIGRFSLESALMVQERTEHIPIYCLEPGQTSNVINANFALNGLSQLISLRNEAASDEDSTAEYKYAPDVLISGRICAFPSASENKTVKTIRLDTLLTEIGCNEAAIIKIDTEGHEPNVLSGFGSLAGTLPNVCIVEFWPATLLEKVNGVNYADYIEQHFVVLNIMSSLYPRQYELIEDIRTFADEYNLEDEGNIDLLFVGKNIPGVDDLVSALVSLKR